MSLQTWNASVILNSSFNTNPGGSSDPPIIGALAMSRIRPIDIVFACAFGATLGLLLAAFI